MKRHSLQWLTLLKGIPRQEENKFTSRMSRIGFVLALCLAQLWLRRRTCPAPRHLGRRRKNVPH